MRPLGKSSKLEERRVKAVKLVVDKKWTQAVAATKSKVSLRTMQAWMKSYRENGFSGLKAKPTPGRPSRLTESQRKKLIKILIKGPRAFGFQTDLWTCPRVSKVVKKELGLSYHVDHIGRLLHQLGFSPQKPERVAIEKDEKVLWHWVKKEWPEIKKKLE